jgi:uncharacterized protein
MGGEGVMYLTKQGLAPPRVPTYDTRPMPEDGSKLCNVAVLADEARHLQLAVPIERMARIAALLVAREGVASGKVAFAREQGRVIADLTLTAQLQLRCQRCLTPMFLPVATHSRVALVASEAEAEGVPPELETALAPDGRMLLADLVEEELLLEVPTAPRHAPGECPAAQSVAQQEEVAQAGQRPFAGLGKLLQSGRLKQ